MKKLSKRFLTLAIACVMAMMMAVPAFADFDNGTTHTYHIKNNTIAGDYVYLNLYGTGGVYASRDVTVYPRTTSDDQVWYITNKVRDVKKVYNSRTDTSGNRYTLNINTNTNNCNVYPDYSSNDADSRVHQRAGHHRGGGVLHLHRRGVRYAPGLQGGKPEPHRGTAQRLKANAAGFRIGNRRRNFCLC